MVVVYGSHKFKGEKHTYKCESSTLATELHIAIPQVRGTEVTQLDYWSTLPAPAASPLVTVPSLASLTPQPEHRSFYRRPLFLILVCLGILVAAVVLNGVLGSPQGSDSYTASLQTAWDTSTPEERAQGCLIANSIGIDNLMNLAASNDTDQPLTADRRTKAASFLRSHCK